MSLSGYANYAIVFTDPRHTTNYPNSVPATYWYFSTDNGSSWSSNIAYAESRNVSWTGNQVQLNSNGSSGYLQFREVHSSGNTNVSNANFPHNGIMHLYNNVSGSSHTAGTYDIAVDDQSGFIHMHGGFSIQESNPINKIKFELGGGVQLGQGTFTLYGLATS